MQCFSPISIRKPNSKTSADRISVPCGVCINCLSRKTEEWSFRLAQELKVAETAHFITLTYTDEQYNKNQGLLCKEDLQKFFKRVRKTGEKIRYYAVGEYGTGTLRPHYHIILFNLQDTKVVSKCWDLGIIHIGKVTEASIKYVCKYIMNKQALKLMEVPPFSIMSTKPAIGFNYLQSAGKYHKNAKITYATKPDGKKIGLPRYYKEKIFNIKEKEKIQTEQTKLLDQKVILKHDELIKLGNNPFEYDMLNIEQRKNQLSKTNKKMKL